MANWNAIRKADTGARKVGSCVRAWTCAAAVFVLSCSSVFGGEQPRTDLSAQDLRASVGSQGLSKPITQVITPELRGDIFMARKMYRDAIDMYRQSATSAAIDNKIGIAFQQLLQPRMAMKYYEQAINEDRNFAEALNNLGTVYYSDRSYGRSINYFKRSLKCSGPVASTYANLGAAYFGTRNYKKASVYYDKALKLDPNALEARSGFGTRLQDTVTDLALFHLYLAKTYAKAGSNERALSYLRKALEEGLKNRKNLAEIPEFSGLKATPQFQELLAENPKPL